jgi:hypothetical protein
MEIKSHPDKTQRQHMAGVLLLSFLSVLLVIIVLLEARHYKRWGHFFTYGVHLDVVRERDILEESNSKESGRIFDYSVVLSNYTFRPLTLSGTTVESDFMGFPELRFRYEVQRWSNQTKQWETIVELDPATKPETRPGQIRIWPGASTTVIPSELTALRKGLSRGDSFRFVVFMNSAGGARTSSATAFYSSPVLIDYQPFQSETPLRVAH